MKYLISILIILAVWLFAGDWVITAKNYTAFGLNQLALWPRQWLKGLARPALTYQETEKLKLENAALKAKLLQLKRQGKTIPSNYLMANIHARYPFNNKNLLSINAGANNGVREGMAVTVKGAFLLGKVEKTLADYSLVKTIFTPAWQIPVRVGKDGADGLLNGSANPRVIMIAKDKEIKEGDAVFSAGRDFPYGIKIGEVEKVERGTATGVFQEADMILPYNHNDLTEVWLIK